MVLRNAYASRSQPSNPMQPVSAESDRAQPAELTQLCQDHSRAWNLVAASNQRQGEIQGRGLADLGPLHLDAWRQLASLLEVSEVQADRVARGQGWLPI